MRRHGFTLVDMAIALVLIGLMGLLTVPAYNTAMRHLRLDGATMELVDALRYASDLAMTHERPFGLYGNVAENRFEVFDQRLRSRSTPQHAATPPATTNGVVQHPVDRGWYTRSWDSVAAQRGVRLLAVPNGGGVVLFYPEGHAHPMTGQFVLGLGAVRRLITVHGVTGRIDVEDSGS